jgi:hypothetical protein
VVISLVIDIQELGQDSVRLVCRLYEKPNKLEPYDVLPLQTVTEFAISRQQKEKP